MFINIILITIEADLTFKICPETIVVRISHRVDNEFVIIILSGSNKWLSPVLKSKIGTQIQINPERCADGFLVDTCKDISLIAIIFELGNILKL